MTAEPFAQPSQPSAVLAPTARASAEDGPQDVARDSYGRYLLPNVDNPKATKPKGYTRATTFAKSISDTYALSMWQQRNAVKGAVTFPDLYAAISSTSLDDSRGMNSLVESAKERIGAKSAAMIGTALHAFTEQVDRGEDPAVPPLWQKGVAAYTELLDASGFVVEQDLIERIVLETHFGIAGTFDRIVRADRDVELTLADGTRAVIGEGERVVLDLKTGKDLSYGWNEIAIQLALYARAGLMYDRPSDTLVPKPKTRTDVGLVIHLPAVKITEDSATATMHTVDLEAGWDAAALCAAVRTWRNVRKLAAPLATSTVIAAADSLHVVAERTDVVKRMTPSLREKIDTTTTEAELYDLRHAETLSKAWTADADEYAVKRLKKIRAEHAGG